MKEREEVPNNPVLYIPSDEVGGLVPCIFQVGHAWAMHLWPIGLGPAWTYISKVRPGRARPENYSDVPNPGNENPRSKLLQNGCGLLSLHAR